jgi:hypothetical protein
MDALQRDLDRSIREPHRPEVGTETRVVGKADLLTRDQKLADYVTPNCTVDPADLDLGRYIRGIVTG